MPHTPEVNPIEIEARSFLAALSWATDNPHRYSMPRRLALYLFGRSETRRLEADFAERMPDYQRRRGSCFPRADDVTEAVRDGMARRWRMIMPSVSVDDIKSELVAIVGDFIRIRETNRLHEIAGTSPERIRAAGGDHREAAPEAAKAKPQKPRARMHRGDASLCISAALRKHHITDTGFNPDPLSGTDISRHSGASTATVTKFLAKHFERGGDKGQTAYEVACRNNQAVVRAVIERFTEPGQTKRPLVDEAHEKKKDGRPELPAQIRHADTADPKN